MLSACSILCDTMLFTIFVALGINAWNQQQSSTPCHHPLNIWVSIACFQIVAFGVAFSIGRAAEKNAPWWFVEPKSRVAKSAFTLTWAFLLPLLSAWTALGMTWLADTLHSTPECFLEDGYLTPTTCAICQIMAGLVAIMYAVFVANVWDAERCRKANAAAIRSVEDPDLVQRWGQLKPAASMDLCGGLLPQDFDALPRHALECSAGDCVICLDGLKEGDHVRSLPQCGHVFHRACIDLWLLRHTRCPLCTTEVLAKCDGGCPEASQCVKAPRSRARTPR